LTSSRPWRVGGRIPDADSKPPNLRHWPATVFGRSVTYGFGELDMLVPAYAATIGSSKEGIRQGFVVSFLDYPAESGPRST
jgi:hypothetical protein